MNKEKLEGLLEVSCCTYHDGLCGEIYDYVINLQQENQQLKKQKDDVVEFVIKLYQKEYNKTSDWWLQEELCNNFDDMNIFTDFELERMLGEIDG